MEKLVDLHQRGPGIIPGRVRDRPIARGRLMSYQAGVLRPQLPA